MLSSKPGILCTKSPIMKYYSSSFVDKEVKAHMVNKFTQEAALVNDGERF